MNTGSLLGMKIKSLAVEFIAVAVCWSAAAAFGQIPRTPQTYSDIYRSDLTYRRPPADPRRFTYDRLYYNNPAISPYTNLMRPTNSYTNNYFQYVRPEQQRRDSSSLQLEQQQRSREATAGQGVSAYHNHWYGGRQSLGLP